MPGRPLVCMFVCVGRVLVDNVLLGGVRVGFRFLQASWENNCGSVALRCRLARNDQSADCPGGRVDIWKAVCLWAGEAAKHITPLP